jgi:hypothetical protein
MITPKTQPTTTQMIVMFDDVLAREDPPAGEYS